MPEITHTTTNANADQRLSQLLRLKRLETPDQAFWSEFEQEFRSRQLSTFVRVQPLSRRVSRACLILARKAGPPAAAMGAIALTFFAVSNTAYLANTDNEKAEKIPEDVPVALPESTPAAYFVMQEDTQGETELASPITVPHGTIYQVNHLESRRGAVEGYKVKATPVTYSHGAGEQPIGAKVITAKPSY